MSHVICTLCGLGGPEADSEAEATELARMEGFDIAGPVYCPCCREELDEDLFDTFLGTEDPI